MRTQNALRRLVDDILIDNMPPWLRFALNQMLANGRSPESILRHVGRLTGGPQAQPGGTMYLAVWAYLERQTGKTIAP